VLNSGHTILAVDFEGANELLYSRVGENAIMRLAPAGEDPLAVEVRRVGLFDDFWQMTK
jgi:hypothetical protein